MNITTARRRLATPCLILVAAWLPSPSFGQGFAVTPLVLQGDPVPGGGDTFDRFRDVGPVLNDLSQALVVGRYASSPDDRVIRLGGGADRLLMSAGDPAPDGVGTMSTIDNFTMNAAGRAAFAANVESFAGTFDAGGIFSSDGTLVQVARGDELAPDGNGAFTTFPAINRIGAVSVNSAGQVAFRADLGGSTGGTTDNQGIYRGDGTTTTKIVRKGELIGGASVRALSDPTMNDAGEVVFQATLSNITTGFYRADGTTVDKLISTGDPVGGGTVSGYLGSVVPINSSGLAAITVNLSGTSGGSNDNSALYLVEPGSKTLVARKGAAIGPGTLGGFLTNAPALNDSGQVAFNCGIQTGPSTFLEAICVGDGNSLRLVALKGQTPPDGNGVFDSFSALSINNLGQVLFEAFITGASPGAFAGLYVYDVPNSTLTLVARTGDSFAGSTVQTFYHTPLTHLGNSGTPFNNAGQVAFRFDLNDGRSGVAIANPIAPVTVTVTSITFNGGLPTILWTASGGAAVDIYRSTDLTTWGMPIVAGSTTGTFTDPSPPAPPVFYAVVPAGTTFP